MKKLVAILTVSLCVAASCPFLFGQESAEKERKFGPYLTNTIKDNWFIDAGAGTGVFIGGHNAGSFGDRLGFVMDLGFGKWFTPDFGARLSFNYTPTFREIVFGNSWSFTYFAVHADVVWNMFNSIAGYKANRVYQLIPAFGGGYSRMSNASQYPGVSNSFILSMSLINKFRVSELLDINLEIRGIGTKQAQDGFSWNDHTFDCPLSVTAGVSFKLGKQTFSRASGYAANKSDAEDAIRRLRAENDSLASAIAASEAALGALKADNEASAAGNEALKAENARILALLGQQKPEGNLSDLQNVIKERIVFFDKGKSTLYAKEMPSFDTFAKFVKECVDNGKMVELVSTADSTTGTKAVNERLIKERGEYVKNLLVSKYGIPADSLKIKTCIDEENRRDYASLSRCVYVVFE